MSYPVRNQKATIEDLIHSAARLHEGKDVQITIKFRGKVAGGVVVGNPPIVNVSRWDAKSMKYRNI